MGGDRLGHLHARVLWRESADLLALEQAFERLNRFVRENPLPLARALAIARFVSALPHELQGRGYYFSEVRDPFLEALGALRGTMADPEQVALAREALEQLADAGMIPRELAAEVADSLAAAVGAGDATTDARGNRSTLAEIRVPLVLALPAMPGEGTGAAIGVIARLTAGPRIRHAGEPRFRWNNARAAQAAGTLRALEDVSADAFLAAIEGVAARARKARTCSRHLGFDLSLPEKQLPIAGDSIGLALAVAFAGSLAGVADRGRGVRPRAELAWTGSVRPAGEVGAVDRQTLAAKLRAAHFAGCGGIVVPEAMREEAEVEARRQGLALRVLGLGHVADAVSRPEMMAPVALPGEVVEACTHAKRRRAILVAAGVACIALIAYHVPPRPRAVHHAPYGRDVEVTYQGLWPPFPVRSAGPILVAELDDRLDGDRAKRLRLVVASACDVIGGHPGELSVYDLTWRRRIWSYPFTRSGLPLEPKTKWADGAYSTKAGAVGDLDGDRRDEIVLSVCYSPYADSFVWYLDGMRAPSGAVYHDGHLEDLALRDVDGDGQPEVVTTGMHEPSRGISILVLRRQDFQPFARADSSWHRDRQRCLNHLVIPMPPELVPVEGRENLGRGGGGPLTFVAGPGSGITVRYDINATNASVQPEKSPDYLVSFQAPCRDVHLVVNDVMRQRADQWLREGRATINFASEGFVRSWVERCRCADHVQVDWP